MLYTTSAYETLCSEAEAGGHVIKLTRAGDENWGLELLVAPHEDDMHWRAAGVLFPDLRELNLHAAHLLRWLRGYLATPEPTHGQ